MEEDGADGPVRLPNRPHLLWLPLSGCEVELCHRLEAPGSNPFAMPDELAGAS